MSGKYIEPKDILLERIAIIVYLLLCFFFLQLVYTQTKDNIQFLVKLGDISPKEAYKFGNFVDVLNLMLGVVIGNIGWDHKKDVGLYGFWGGLKLFRYALLMVTVTIIMGAVANSIYAYFILDRTFDSQTIEYIFSPMGRFLWLIIALTFWCAFSAMVIEKNTPIGVRMKQ